VVSVTASARTLARRQLTRRSRQAALQQRLAALSEALGSRGGAHELGARLDAALAGEVWLTLAVLGARLPTRDEVLAAVRTVRLDGAAAWVEQLLAELARDTDPRTLRTVEIVADTVLVDLDHTARASFATGIQRVARETARRWSDRHQPVLISWTRDYTALRRLSPAEQHRALHGGPAPIDAAPPADDHILVPLRGTYLLPELAAEIARADRVGGLASYAATSVALIGFDCVPLTTAETTGTGMPGLFARLLSAVAEADRIAPISEGAAGEYRGWRRMLSGTGLAGPDIQAIELATGATTAGDEPDPAAARAAALDRLAPGARPMVLVVGSHEPRKNHLAVLHAAELLWRDNLDFALVFLGGNAWNSGRFERRIAELQQQGRPVQSVSGLSDELLAGAYQLARCTVFPSLNEGFGLPIAESLSFGTPVITSDFGSMRDIAATGGALLVDPRQDHQIAAALRTLLTDDAAHAALRAQARARPVRGWDEYAALTWAYLVEGQDPGPVAAASNGSPVAAE